MKLHFTVHARTDLLSIAEYTRDKWGNAQALRYLDRLQDSCERLRRLPSLGRRDPNLPQYWRFEVGRHVVFFRRDKEGVLVIRILHQRMLPDIVQTWRAPRSLVVSLAPCSRSPWSER